MAEKLNTKSFILSSLKDKVQTIQQKVQKQIIMKAKEGCKTCGGNRK